MRNPPSSSWTRKLDASMPSSSTHWFARPPLLEALSLLPVAYRVGSYIQEERSQNKDPIFDLSGFLLEPPNPGPHAGVPLGGIGSGCIGKGWRGDFNRWSLHPGRYIHKAIHANNFYLRVKRANSIHTKILSVFPDQSGILPPLSAGTATYHAVHPRAWTVFEQPVPGTRVTLRQISPFLPHSYSDASAPAAIFHVEVENLLPDEPMEASVMFTFQNGYDQDGDAAGGFLHRSFEVQNDAIEGSEGVLPNSSIAGVSMGHHKPSKFSPGNQQHARKVAEGTTFGSFAIAASAQSSTELSQFRQFVVRTREPESQQCMDQSCTTRSSTCFSCSVVDGSCRRCSTVTSMSSGTKRRHRVSIPTGSNSETRGDRLSDCVVLFQKTGELLPTVAEPEADGETDLSGRNQSFQSSQPNPTSRSGQVVGAAVCLKKTVAGGECTTFSFALAWDNPWVSFGKEEALPRYYTRFFGTSGGSAGSIASYALLQAQSWEDRIIAWQEEALCSFATSSGHPLPNYYRHQLFNELYYLTDGGSVWTDSTDGKANINIPSATPPYASSASSEDNEFVHRMQVLAHGSGRVAPVVFQMDRDTSDQPLMDIGTRTSSDDADVMVSPNMKSVNDLGLIVPVHENFNSPSPMSATNIISRKSLTDLALHMTAHDMSVQTGKILGDSSKCGQFMYLEGHEYQMYSTYDVHFYAGFALATLWPHLDYVLQRNFASSVGHVDNERRVMMGTGLVAERKAGGCVPHDMGSPSEAPWRKLNAYNFQDVSAWRDLGPKFVLQIYRDYLSSLSSSSSTNLAVPTSFESSKLASKQFLLDMFPSVRLVMQTMETFDSDGDGMIENSGYPDQTYDIWVAKGVHAYCGGLYIAACSASAAISKLCGDEEASDRFTALAQRAQRVYVALLWNGRYLDYDSSQSEHHDSIMADMLAGQWWARVCRLPPVLPPQQALSCYRTIFEYNVVKFAVISAGIGGDGARDRGHGLCGAVNGMRPDGRVDDCCLQSREVWTGTTYGLAAAMLQESFADEDALNLPEQKYAHHCRTENSASLEMEAWEQGTHLSPLIDSALIDALYSSHSIDSNNLPSIPATMTTHESLSPAERAELRTMAYATAQGIHDAGWQKFGYWFSTPEAWSANGNYRSLGYMRPLAIWAMQFAATQI